ncbi:hypothetical protein [Argonema antarcticum]|nr:hypothetical protein [Argonema antarcticum A004/B2]
MSNRSVWLSVNRRQFKCTTCGSRRRYIFSGIN